MRKSKLDFLELIACGAYYALQKKDDRNLEDITIRRLDGHPEEIHNYPYRTNQMPAYIFQEFLGEGILEEADRDEAGGRIFRVTERVRHQMPARGEMAAAEAFD